MDATVYAHYLDQKMAVNDVFVPVLAMALHRMPPDWLLDEYEMAAYGLLRSLPRADRGAVVRGLIKLVASDQH